MKVGTVVEIYMVYHRIPVIIPVHALGVIVYRTQDSFRVIDFYPYR